MGRTDYFTTTDEILHLTWHLKCAVNFELYGADVIAKKRWRTCSKAIITRSGVWDTSIVVDVWDAIESRSFLSTIARSSNAFKTEGQLP